MSPNKKQKKTKKVEVKESKTHDSQTAQASEPQQANSEQPTVTTTDTVRAMSGGKRGVCAMYKVVVKKARGKKTKVTFNDWGIADGETRARLQSYIGMLARTLIPIDIASWPKVDPELKSKLWIDIQVLYSICKFYILLVFSIFTCVVNFSYLNFSFYLYFFQSTFKVKPHCEHFVLKSAGCKWRQFKTNLTRKFVRPYVGQKEKLSKPPKQYAFVSKSTWKRFVRQRTDPTWEV